MVLIHLPFYHFDSDDCCLLLCPVAHTYYKWTSWILSYMSSYNGVWYKIQSNPNHTMCCAYSNVGLPRCHYRVCIKVYIWLYIYHHVNIHSLHIRQPTIHMITLQKSSGFTTRDMTSEMKSPCNVLLTNWDVNSDNFGLHYLSWANFKMETEKILAKTPNT